MKITAKIMLMKLMLIKLKNFLQLTFTYSNLTTKTEEQGVQYV